MPHASVHARRRLARVAAVLAALCVLGGVVVPSTPATAATTADEAGCTVSDAELVWGFKESFRAYIDGAIAQGEWTTSGDASYATPLFTWSGGAGGTEPDDALVVEFSGAVRFTGHGGVLDTTIENPRLVIRGDRACREGQRQGEQPGGCGEHVPHGANSCRNELPSAGQRDPTGDGGYDNTRDDRSRTGRRKPVGV